jgi:hypothetical protein
MKAAEFRKLIREEVQSAMNEDPASNLLSLLASPEMKKYMDRLSNTIDQKNYMVIKSLYTKLYDELKKHE